MHKQRIRSKTQPVPSPQPLTLSWSLVRKKSVDHQSPHNTYSLVLPPIVRNILNQQQKEVVSLKVIRMLKIGYDPIGCSKSSKLQKILLRKKINRRKVLNQSQALRQEADKVFKQKYQ